MPLYRYKITLEDGKERSSRLTAKTEEAAKEAIKALPKFSELKEIKLITTPKVSAAAPTQAPLTEKTAKPAGKLDRLLYLQSHRCFFCGRSLKREEASVEHLMPRASNGNDDDGNVVACCVALNRAFGSISLKEKIRIILDKAGSFSCPKP